MWTGYPSTSNRRGVFSHVDSAYAQNLSQRGQFRGEVMGSRPPGAIDVASDRPLGLEPQPELPVPCRRRHCVSRCHVGTPVISCWPAAAVCRRRGGVAGRTRRSQPSALRVLDALPHAESPHDRLGEAEVRPGHAAAAAAVDRRRRSAARTGGPVGDPAQQRPPPPPRSVTKACTGSARPPSTSAPTCRCSAYAWPTSTEQPPKNTTPNLTLTTGDASSPRPASPPGPQEPRLTTMRASVHWQPKSLWTARVGPRTEGPRGAALRMRRQ